MRLQTIVVRVAKGPPPVVPLKVLLSVAIITCSLRVRVVGSCRGFVVSWVRSCRGLVVSWARCAGRAPHTPSLTFMAKSLFPKVQIHFP